MALFLILVDFESTVRSPGQRTSWSDQVEGYQDPKQDSFCLMDRRLPLSLYIWPREEEKERDFVSQSKQNKTDKHHQLIDDSRNLHVTNNNNPEGHESEEGKEKKDEELRDPDETSVEKKLIPLLPHELFLFILVQIYTWMREDEGEERGRHVVCLHPFLPSSSVLHH